MASEQSSIMDRHAPISCHFSQTALRHHVSGAAPLFAARGGSVRLSIGMPRHCLSAFQCLQWFCQANKLSPISASAVLCPGSLCPQTFCLMSGWVELSWVTLCMVELSRLC